MTSFLIVLLPISMVGLESYCFPISILTRQQVYTVVLAISGALSRSRCKLSPIILSRSYIMIASNFNMDGRRFLQCSHPHVAAAHARGVSILTEIFYKHYYLSIHNIWLEQSDLREAILPANFFLGRDWPKNTMFWCLRPLSGCLTTVPQPVQATVLPTLLRSLDLFIFLLHSCCALVIDWRKSLLTSRRNTEDFCLLLPASREIIRLYSDQFLLPFGRHCL
jgi:hypothetical protein